MRQPNELLTKGVSYIFKVLEAGEKYYYPQENSKGTIILTEEMMMSLTEDLVGKPIIIDHISLNETNIDNHNQIIVGRIIKAFQNKEGFKLADGTFIEPDNASYVEGIIDKQTGIDYINKGYLPSIFYIITDEKKEGKNKTIVLSGESNHLGLVENPKFDTAIYQINKNNNQRFTMSNKATAIANGTIEPMQNEMEDMSLENLFIKDEEGNEYSLEEVFNATYEEMDAEAEKKYFDKTEMVKNGKTYNVQNMLAKYKAKKAVENQTVAQEAGIENKCEVANSAIPQTQQKTGIAEKIKNLITPQQDITFTIGGSYKPKIKNDNKINNK